MRNKRHEKILELIKKYDIDTQEDLQLRLSEFGWNVTQATVSRDISALRLIKVIAENGVRRYIRGESKDKPENIPQKTNVYSIIKALNQVVVRTQSGYASAVAAEIDSASLPQILGSVAGDDTIIIITPTERDAYLVVNHLTKLLNVIEQA